ncbi:MAG TPA: gamma carbonic anhydrase family protein [Syntrophorhabdaceae bacterium]|jgi:carbonic anhydrase/acetyltransferase-like protein (isoleucine patch superfamily)
MTRGGYITPFGGATPVIHEKAYVDISARIIGNVSIAAGASIWPGAVLRADSDLIRVGERAAVLDLALIEAPENQSAILEEEALISHGAIIHGALIGARSLIGIGAIVLDGAVIGTGSIVAAGSLVPPGMDVPPNSLVMGTPAKRVRETTPEERENMMKQLHGLYRKSRIYLKA